MAEFDDLGSDGVVSDGASVQTGEAMDGQAEPPGTQELFSPEQPDDPNDPNWKYWQAAYTRGRQRDRERYGKLEQEHAQFGVVLRNFYTSDEYALQVMRQRFPQLAGRLSLDSTSSGVSAGPGGSSGLTQALEQHLGPDLAFLAPRLGPVLEQVLSSYVGQAIRPLQQQSEQQQAAARRSKEDELLSVLDAQHPGWEDRYGGQMRALDDFLNSDALTHPQFGDKYSLYLRLLNPDMARVDAARSLSEAGRGRVITGRAGPTSRPTIAQQVSNAKTNADAFRLAAQAAIAELRRGA